MTKPFPQTFSPQRIAISFVTAALTALGGCAVNSRAGFDQVQRTIEDRTGHRVVWNTGGAEDQQVQQRVHNMLQRELSVEEAVQIALLNNADLQVTYEELGVAQAELVQAGLLKNPVISAEIRFPARPHYPVEANLEEEFLDVFFLPLRKKVAEAAFEEAKATVASAVIGRASEVRAAFYKCQGAEELLDLRRTVLEAAEANLDASRHLRQAGNSRELDYANDQGSAAQARIELSHAEAEAVEDREELTILMGVWGPDAATWKVAARLPDLPEADIPLKGLESLAISQRQDLVASRNATLGAARMAGFANYASVFSGATFGAHFQHDADVKNTIGPAISVPIPIFDQGQAASARAAAQFRQAQARYQSLAVQIRSQIRKAHFEMDTDRQRAAYFKEFVFPLRHRILEQTQLQYNGMFIGVSGLLQAKQEEITAGVQYVESVRDYWIAHSELEKAVGGRLPQGILREAQSAPAPSAIPAAIRPDDMQSMPGMNNAK